MNLVQMAMTMIEKNPRVAGNPMAKEFVDILKTGDNARGEKMAENICNSYGVTKEQALQQARQRFGV